MNKRFLTLFFAVLAMLLLLLLTSCSEELAAPEELKIDDDNQLSWASVESARIYTVEIQNVNGGDAVRKTTRQTNYSLSDLTVGDYEIRVMATGGAENELTSDWSSALSFHRDYESGCVYELYNGNSEYRITGAGSASNTVLIEGTYRGKPVTAIADNAFKGNRSIVNVVLGENIRSIGENAFYNCPQLQSVSLPESLTSVGISAFQGCRALVAVNIPSKLTAIPDYCFTYCRALASVRLSDNIKTIGESAFAGTALTAVEIPDGTEYIGPYAFSAMNDLTEVHIGRGVKTICEYAFSENPLLASVVFAQDSVLDTIGNRCFVNDKLLGGIELPSGMTDIGDRCFYGCTEFSSVTIPDSVTHIGSMAFNATKLYADSTSDFVYADRWLVAVKNLNAYKKIDATHIKDNTVGISDTCFYQAQLLESVTLPASVKTVGKFAFQSCPELAEFKAGASLLRIQYAAFNACEKLYKLNLTNSSLTEIDDYAFYGCKALDNNALTPIIPKSVTRIGLRAFEGTRLWSNPDENNIIYAGTWVVGYKDGATIGEATLKDTVTGIADYAFSDCDSLVTLGNLTRCLYIGEGAFYNCTQLMSVALHSRLTTLPDYVFYKCSNLLNIAFPTMLESIGRSAFYKCSSIFELDFSETYAFRSIGDYAFYGCTNLKTVDFGENLTDIGTNTFYRCKSLKSVSIPNTLQVIPDDAFAFCSVLESVVLGSGVEHIGSRAFYKCEMLNALCLPDAVKTVGDNAFYKCSGIKTLEIGNAVQSIGDYAFYGLEQIETLRLPATLTLIGKYAFKGAAALKTLIIPASVTEIRVNAFYGCYQATFYIEEGADTHDWNLRWNSSNRPVVFGVHLSDTGDYVVSVTVNADTVKNDKNLTDAIKPIASPERVGYTFAGWVRQDGTAVGTEELSAQSEGTALTAVWTPLS